ncbi:NAD-dependent epimerase/dehydratase family protein, partial [bacterium]|nr:NAD-dependent epimerase/dehydratase family protein [bacterium]
MILLTGAAGKTGTSILKYLTKKGAEVRSLVRTPQQSEKVISLGSKETVIGDMTDRSTLTKAIIGIDRVYYIAPNVSPDEFSVGQEIIHLARVHNVKHFVYHSVLHPQIEA